MSQHPPAIFIMGPTASGKTDLAMALYDRLPCELISVDSALVYRQMDIGTAKPSRDELRQYPHHLIDIIDPIEAYSAASFREDALRLMNEASAKGRVPVLVGGTMLYYRALQNGLAELPNADPEVRARLEQEALVHGWAHMHQRLVSIDPESAQRIHPNDPQRIQRALEVFEISGRTMTQWYEEQKRDAELPFNLAKVVVAPSDRAVLHQRIELRFKLMLERGFIAEVERLRARGDLDLSLPSMRSVGYRQVWQYLDGEMDYAEMEERGIVATRQFAKRQFTWLRTEQETMWFDSQMKNLTENVLKYLSSALNLDI